MIRSYDCLQSSSTGSIVRRAQKYEGPILDLLSAVDCQPFTGISLFLALVATDSATMAEVEKIINGDSE